MLTNNNNTDIESTLKYSVFISTAHKDAKDEQALTGDIDYAWAIAAEVNSRLLINGEPGAVAIKGLFNEEDVYSYVWKHAAGPNPVLHVMINAPKTGYAFTPEGLKKFKEAGGRVLITSVEFYKYIKNEYRDQGLKYLAEAEGIIFLDELDRTDALESLEAAYPKVSTIEPKVALLRQRLENAHIVSVPPTIPPITISFDQRGGDILSFGMIRFGKGFAHVIKLANLMRNSQDPVIKAKKILVVGSVQEHDIRNKELHRLMEAIYPSKVDDIKKSTIVELKKLLKEYQVDSSLTPALPIELHIDIPVNQLPPLFNRCKYAFLPAYRGASLRNSSISSCLAQPFVIFTHNGDITPRDLQSGGEHQHAMVLVESDNYHTYADKVLESLIARENDPSLNAITMVAANNLMNTLSREAIIQKHLSIYNRLAQNLEPELLRIKTKHEKKSEQIAFNWMLKTQANRSDKLMKKMTDFEVRKLGEENYRALLERLKNLEGSLTAETKSLIAKNRKEGHILTSQEKTFLSAVLGGPWALKHVTPYIEDIRKGGNVMLSVEERNRRTNKKVANSHTNPAEGHLDNVFFSFGPGDFETVRFLDKVPKAHVVVGNFKELVQQENCSIKNMWSSDHFYAYATEQTGERVRLYGTTYNVNYRLILSKQKDTPARWVKECEFTHPDGTVYKQIIEKGQEIFTYPRLDIALVLLTIEKIRLLGAKAWQEIMQETDLAILQSIVHAFYHSGVHELHKPVRFNLDQPGVTVVERSVKTEGSNALTNSFLPIDQDSKINVLKEFLKGNLDFALRIIKEKSLDLEEKIFFQGIGINFLGAAIVGGNLQLIQELLNAKVDMEAFCVSYFHGQVEVQGQVQVQNHVQITPINFIVYMSNVIQAQELVEKILPGRTIDHSQMLKSLFEIFKLLIDKKCINKNNPNISLFAVLDALELEFVLRIPSPSISMIQVLLNHSSIPPKELPIGRAVATGSIEIVQDMLNRGADVNSTWTITKVNLPTKIALQAGYTPLFVAVLTGNLPMCEFLVRQGATVDLPNITPSVEGQITQTHHHEGFTPLQLAVELEHKDIVEFLLGIGADLRHRAANNSSVFNIAKKKKNDEILELLRNFASLKLKMSLDELITLENTENLSAEFKINDDKFYIVISFVDENGKRIFLEQGVDTSAEVKLLSFESAATRQQAVSELLEYCNSLFVLGLGEDDFSMVELGRLTLEVPDEKVLYRAKILSFELTKKSVLPRLFELSKSFDLKKQIYVTAEDASRVFDWSELSVEVQAGWFSRLEMEILRSIANMGENVRSFTQVELEKLEKQYQQAVLTQHRLVAAIRKGQTSEVEKSLEEGVLINEPTLVFYDAIDLNPNPANNAPANHSLTPFEASILYGQYACANLLFDKLNSTVSDSEDSFTIKDAFVEKIVRDGQIELFKKLCNLKVIDLTTKFERYFSLAVQSSHVELSEYILSCAPKPSEFEFNNFLITYASRTYNKTVTESMLRFLVSRVSPDGIKRVLSDLVIKDYLVSIDIICFMLESAKLSEDEVGDLLTNAMYSKKLTLELVNACVSRASSSSILTLLGGSYIRIIPLEVFKVVASSASNEQKDKVFSSLHGNPELKDYFEILQDLKDQAGASVPNAALVFSVSGSAASSVRNGSTTTSINVGTNTAPGTLRG